MSLQNIANHLAQHGRGNDKMLVHMTPNEVGGLQQLAQAHGGSLTINPHTGLPEAGFLDSLMPTIIGAGLTYFSGGMIDPMTAAGIVGGIQTARTGDIGKGLMAGLGAYGGAGLTGGLMGAGANAIGEAAGANALSTARTNVGDEALAAHEAATNAVAKAGPMSTMGAGIQSAYNDPSGFVKQMGGGMGLAQKGLMAAAPMLAAPQTTTPMPSKNPTAYVQTKMVNPYTKEVYDVSKVPADQWGGRTYADERNNADLSRYITAADGGLMGMAPGQFNYAQMQPAVDLHSTIGANLSNTNQPQNMAEGGVAHFDDGGYTSYTPEQIQSYFAANPTANVAAATQEFHADPAAVAAAGYAPAGLAALDRSMGAATPAQAGQIAINRVQDIERGGTNTSGLYVNGSPLAMTNQAALQGPLAIPSQDGSTSTPGLYVNGSPAATTAQAALPNYTSYTPDQVTNYIQTSGIDLSNPNAVNAALAQAHMDPTAYAAYMKSSANPYSVSALSNPTLANVSNFDKSLGANPSTGALTDIRNAVVTAQNTSGGPNTATNMPANMQIAKEMDLWNVDPTTMGKAVNMSTAEVQALYDAVNPNGKYASKAVVPTVVKPTTTVTPTVTTPTSINTAPAATLKPGVGGNTGAGVVGGGTVVNPNGTITESPRIPGIPVNGFTGMGNVVDTYTAGGGSTGYVPKAPTTMDEFNARYNKLSGGSKAAFDYLSGAQGANYPTVPSTSTGQIMQPYSEAVLGIPQSATIPATQKYFVDSKTHKLTLNPAYNAAANADAASVAASGAAPSLSSKTISIPVANGAPPRNATQLADYPGFYFGSDGRYYDEKGNVVADTAEQFAAVHGANGGLMGMAMGGSAHPSFFSKATGKFNFHPAKIYAGGGSTDQYNLGSYSDGGRLLRGPGDGVSDSIPATIGKGQPARLADGEFVVPARIVSELGNGSTDAGAKQLYAMMDRIQKARSSTVGKGKVATNTRAAKYLPA